MKKHIKVWGAFCALLVSLLVTGQVHASEDDLPVTAKTGEGVEIFAGAAKGSGQGTELTFLYSEHVGGTFDAAGFTEGTYLTLDYTGAEKGVYIALVSSSGGRKWTAIYPSSSESTGENTWRQTYSYEAMTKAWGDNFAKLDIVQVYANTETEVTVNRIAYVLGDGAVADTTDGTWDVPMEGIAFIGDSIVQNPIFFYEDWNGVLGRKDCVNYGIGGQTTKELEKRIDDVLKGNYEKIVFLCGINDIGRGRQPFVICAAYRDMLDAIAEKCPNTDVLILSVLPTTDAFYKDGQGNIQTLNYNLEYMTGEYDFVTFVDIYSAFVGEDGYGKAEYYTDGLHPNEMGYKIIADIITPYLDDNTEEAQDGKQTDAVSGDTFAALDLDPTGIGLLVLGGVVVVAAIVVAVNMLLEKKAKAKKQ